MRGGLALDLRTANWCHWTHQLASRHRPSAHVVAAAAAAVATPHSPLPPENHGKAARWAPPPKTPATPPRATAAAAAAARQPAAAQPSAAGGSARRGPDSLHAICLGVLGEHLGYLLDDPECWEGVLPHLPAQVKACLLAVARLRRLLCDTALLLLADAEQTVLDLHGCGDRISDAAVQQALQRMPHLRQARRAAGGLQLLLAYAAGEGCLVLLPPPVRQPGCSAAPLPAGGSQQLPCEHRYAARAGGALPWRGGAAAGQPRHRRGGRQVGRGAEGARCIWHTTSRAAAKE